MNRSITFRVPTMQVRCGLCGTVAHELRRKADRAEAVIDCSCTIPQFEVVYADGAEAATTIPLRPARTK